jgi:hypothetical protein
MKQELTSLWGREGGEERRRRSAAVAPAIYGEYVPVDMFKAIADAGLDGVRLATTFVAASLGSVLAGSGIGRQAVASLGLGAVVASALYSSMGSCLSSNAQNRFLLSEKASQERMLRADEESAIREMITLYENWGMKPKDADSVIRKIAKERAIFVNVRMRELLGLQLPVAYQSSAKDGFIAFCSYLINGCMPLLLYVFLPGSHVDIFASALGYCLVSAFVLGTMKVGVGTAWSLKCSSVSIGARRVAGRSAKG